MIKGVMGVYCSRHSNCRYKQECWIWPWWWWPKAAGQSSDTICSVQRPDCFAILKSPKIFLSLSVWFLFDYFWISFQGNKKEFEKAFFSYHQMEGVSTELFIPPAQRSFRETRFPCRISYFPPSSPPPAKLEINSSLNAEYSMLKIWYK